MIYYWTKTVHVWAVVFNVSFFMLRFYWMLRGSKWVQHRVVRRVSQINDTLLLAAALGLALMSRQYPFVAPWLTAKVIALVAYIIFGSLALRHARGKKARAWCGMVALGCVGYILAVALNRSPTPWY